MVGQKKGSKRGQMIQLSVRLKPGQVAVMNHVSRTEGLTVSQIIRKLISDSLVDGYLADKFDLQIEAAAYGPKEKKK